MINNIQALKDMVNEYIADGHDANTFEELDNIDSIGYNYYSYFGHCNSPLIFKVIADTHNMYAVVDKRCLWEFASKMLFIEDEFTEWLLQKNSDVLKRLKGTE